MKPISARVVCAVFVLFSVATTLLADATAHNLAGGNLTQDWTSTGQITANDNWSGVPSIEGYLGQDITTVTGTDPQTLLTTSGSAGDLSVLANQTVTTITNGDVAEFHTTSQAGAPGSNPTIALQGSGTADAPYLLLYLNTTGRTNVNVAYNLRDIDCTADNSVQPVALQYRVGNSGNFTNVAAGFNADATTGGSLCTAVTAISAALPAAVDNQALVQVRIMTTNAVGNDEWVGIDDIVVSSSALPVGPTLNIDDVSLGEGNAGGTTFTFTVSLTAPAGVGGVTFDIATADGTAEDDVPATEDNDYVAQSLTSQTIPAGSSTFAFNVTVNGDTAIEANETFFVNVTNIVNATAGDTQGQGTITNDDSPPNLTINDVSLSEGNAGVTTFTFTVSLSAPAQAGGVTFDIATADNTATTANSDYVAKSLLAQTIPAGNSTYSFDVDVNGDALFEAGESFFVNVTNVTGAIVTDGQGLGTINNDDAAPTLAIADVVLTEGDAGTQNMTFTVTMSVPVGSSVSVDYTTANGSATTGDNDYALASGTLTFVPSDTSESFTVTINGDTNIEGDEQFFVNLSNATGGATISDNQALGIIRLDDAFSIAAVDTAYVTNFDVMESTGTFAATTPAAWTMSESSTASNATYSINDGASNTGNTYSYGTTATTDRAFGGLQSGSLIPTIGAFFRNDTGVTITTLSIQYKGEEWRLGTAGRADRLDFQYSTDATSLTTGTWTDVDNLDFSTPNTVGAGAKVGNNAGNFTNVNYTMSGLAIAPGAAFWIRYNDVNASGADDGLAVDDFSIIANIAGGVMTINDVSLTEGNAGTQLMSFTVSLTQPAGAGGVTFDIATADNTATTADSDYVANSVVGATIPAGQSTYTFDVTINGDTNQENSESFFVNISNVVGTAVSDPQGVGTIIPDDFPAFTMIHDIQGNGLQSPIPGSNVYISGIVTGIKGGGSGGFFVQEEEADYDADPNTSEGVFVFTSGVIPAGVQSGTRVVVNGTVSEFPSSANPHTVTEVAGTVTTFVQATGQPLPAAMVITLAEGQPTSNVSQYEQYEGMRVSVPSMTVVAPTQGNKDEPNANSSTNGVFFGVVTGVARPFRELGLEQTAIVPSEASCPACIDRWDMNPEKIRVDSDGQPGATALDVAAGQTVTGLVGPLDFGFFEYTLLPDPGISPVVSGDNTFDSAPAPTATELTVAGYNLERFYDTVDDPNSDTVLTPAAVAKRLNKASLAIRNALQTPDVVGVVEVENLSVLQQLATKLNTDTAGATNYQAYLDEGNDIGGIDVGFLVNANRVSVNSVTQFGKTATFIDPSDSSVDLLNDRPPLVLEAQIARPDASIFEFTVIVNHLRSLNGIDTDDAAGQRIRAKRAAQAEYLANLVQTRQTSDPAERILLVGDFNAFQFHDGYVDMIGTIKGTPAPASEVVVGTSDLVSPDLTNLVETVPANIRYSYSFDGSSQVIDHALVNAAMLPSVTRFAFAHVDSDFPDVFRSDSTRPERISDHDGTVTYLDLTPAATAAIGDVGQAEGNAANSMTFTVTLSGAQAIPVTIDYTTSNGSATAGSDYTTTSGTLTFVPGDISEDIVVPILGDLAFETNETFTVTLSNPSFNVTLSDATATGTIQNDDAQSQISVGDVSLNEGNIGTTTFTFVVSLDAPAPATVTVDYATGSGVAIAGSDFNATSGTLTFNIGESSKNVDVAVIGDTVFEPNENFIVQLSSPSANATLADGVGSGTILNDDAQSQISIGGAGVAEGDAGTSLLTFNVTLDAPATSTVTVNYATSDNTATAGSDYVAAAGTVTFNVGDSSKNVDVTINGDTTFEPNETFNITLSSPSANAVILDGSAVGTIANDEGTSVISIGDVSQNEGNAGTSSFTFAVTLNVPTTSSVTVDYATSNGSATAGSDYVAASGTVTFNTGESSKNVVITVNGDTTFEPNENFFVTLTNASVNATIADNSGTGTIQNDDGPQADLAITKTASDTTPQSGDQVTFTIVVTNNGPDQATGVVVTDDLPSGMSFVSATSTVGSCNAADPVVCTIGTLANGQSATITLTVLITGGPGQYTNSASADSNETDANGATSASPIVVGAANLNGIPTLSEWALLGLMTMLAAIAAMKLK
ncbi:MAG TPA: IPTL-CTERM sorting domain-containing protein [Thermoanaerobaculia bacterium]|nr:IPTL-CTERM sorting domain-containing protein [Thermoanaerobaculia bacterium]